MITSNLRTKSIVHKFFNRIEYKNINDAWKNWGEDQWNMLEYLFLTLVLSEKMFLHPS